MVTIVTFRPDPLHGGLAQGDQVLTLRHLALGRVEQLVLDEEDGIVVPDRRRQQALRIGRGRGHDDLEAGNV